MVSGSSHPFAQEVDTDRYCDPCQAEGERRFSEIGESHHQRSAYQRDRAFLFLPVEEVPEAYCTPEKGGKQGKRIPAHLHSREKVGMCWCK